MNVSDLMAVLRRRWYVLLAGLLATTGACVLAFQAVPVDYEANASLLLLPPKSSVAARGNPYLSLSGLTDAVDVLGVSLNADATKQAIDKAHPQVESEVGRDTSTNTPILVISTSGPSAAESLAVLNQIVSIVPDRLASLQADVGVTTASSRITLRAVAADKEPEANTKTRTRAVIALAGLGAVFTVLMAGAVDRLLSQHAMLPHARGISSRSGDRPARPRALAQGLMAAARRRFPHTTTAARALPHQPLDVSADSGDQVGGDGDQAGAQKGEASPNDLVSSISSNSDE
jgi:capsular polysaccharide biosynthesis protein